MTQLSKLTAPLTQYLHPVHTRPLVHTAYTTILQAYRFFLFLSFFFLLSRVRQTDHVDAKLNLSGTETSGGGRYNLVLKAAITSLT